MAKKEPAIIKRDTKENWEKSKYIPKENVIVIMDNPDGSISLMVGDGEKNVNALPFIDAHTFDENGVIKQNALPEGYPYVTSDQQSQ